MAVGSDHAMPKLRLKLSSVGFTMWDSLVFSHTGFC